MIKKHWLIGYIVAALTMSVMGVAAHTTVAQAGAFNALTISPVRSDIEIAPGASKDVAITLTNPSKTAVSVQAVENDFVSRDEDGTPSFILDPNSSAPTHSLKEFMQPIAPVTINPKESKVVKLTITVPQTAQAGGYFGGVRFITDRKDTNGQVNMNASLATIVLLRVSGDAVEKLAITNFTVHEAGDTIDTPFFQNPKNLELTLRAENKGNIQLSPFGKITIHRGKELVYEADFNDNQPRDMVLPDGARSWKLPIKNVSGFGHYTAQATIAYGDNNTTTTITKSFWVVPWKVLIWIGAGVIGVIALVIIISTTYRFRHRRRKPKLGGGRSHQRPRMK